MPAVDLAPLMNSPLWKNWDEPTRAEAKRLLEDPGTSAEDRAEMLQLLQGARAPVPVEAPPPAVPAVSPATPSPWEALKGAFTGEQRLPFQAGAPEQGMDPAALGETASRESTAGKVIGAVTGATTSPSSLGELTGTVLAPGWAKPFAGAAGAALGEGYRQWQGGEPMDLSKIGKEAAWSLVPEVGLDMAKGAMRQFARNSPGGQRLRFDRAAEEAREMPGRVFQPRPADQISDAFEQVRRSGLNIDTDDIRRHLTTLSPGKQADTLNILTNLDRQHRTGGRYAQLYQDLLSGQGMRGSSIGDLQNMRSVLRQHAEQLTSPESRQLVRDLQGAVDDTIDFGLTSGASAASTPQIRDMLHGARRDWARRTAADDLGDLIETKISSSPNLQDSTFSLRGLYDELRRGRSEASRSINRSLDLTPGARERFQGELQDLSRLYQNIEMSMTDVAGISRMPAIAGARQAIGQLLLTDTGRRMFQEAVIEGRGRLSPNALATLVNAARREMMPEMTQGQPAREDEGFSLRAPGGVARRTD